MVRAVLLCVTCGKTFKPRAEIAAYEQHLLRHWIGEPLVINSDIHSRPRGGVHGTLGLSAYLAHNEQARRAPTGARKINLAA